ncbi:winged helix-turn-helix domain-containing protein [Faecalimonas sp.]
MSAQCKHHGWHPYPATCIAESLDLSVHKVRYHLRKLKEQGLVYSFQEGGMEEDGQVFCLRGWELQGKQSIQRSMKRHLRKNENCAKNFLALILGKKEKAHGKSNFT